MNTQRVYLLFCLVCTLFGSTFLAIGLGLGAGASPLFFAGLRFTSAGCILIAGLWMAGRLSRGGVRALAGRACIFSLVMTVGTFGCMFIAQTRVDSGFMARLDAAGPIATALFAAMLLQKRLKLSHWTAFTLGTAGSFFIAAPALHTETLYLAFATGSVLFYGLGNVLYSLLFSKNDDPILISALQACIGGIILLAVALLTEPIRFPAAAVLPFVYLVLGGSVLGHTATLILVRDAGPVFASGWLYVAPVVATALGALVLNEPVTLSGVAGTILALTGVCILARAERQEEKKADVSKECHLGRAE
jgi:drug/metabolite transporter (DMT)-like permease